MYVLLPGRHHVFTAFQWRELDAIVSGQRADLAGQVLDADETTVVVAITSANHSNTRRNPVPADLRSAQAHLAAHLAGLSAVTVHVRDIGHSDRFADQIVAAVHADEAVADQHGRPLDLSPANCVVASSTPAVALQFARRGFRIFGMELTPDVLGSGDDVVERLADTATDPAWSTRRPWQLVEALAAMSGDIDDCPAFLADVHEGSERIWRAHRLGHRVDALFRDPIVGADSDLTTGRNYAVYMSSFDRGADRKWALLEPHVEPGRIVDIGCATGSILALAGEAPGLAESDLFGIELSRSLYDECQHRHRMGAFPNPNTFFLHRNALDDLFAGRSVNTTMTISLTHEIVSYVDDDALDRLSQRIFDQTAPGGVWLIYDVCAPVDQDRIVRLDLRDDDGEPATAIDVGAIASLPDDALTARLESLSTRARFAVFAAMFRAEQGESLAVAGSVRTAGDGSVELRLGDAMDFLAHRTYTDSWRSEMNERFCFRSIEDWRHSLQAIGFEVDPASRGWTNPWLAEHRFDPVARLSDAESGTPMPWPHTNVMVVARRPH